MILILFIHIKDTVTNITYKISESCYKKHTVHWCSGNFGITTCTTASSTGCSLRA